MAFNIDFIMKEIKYKIVSKREGTLALFHNNKTALFSRDESVVMDFLSISGAERMIEVMRLLDKEFPDDIVIIPFEK